MEHDRHGLLSLLIEGIAGFIVGLFWLAVVGLGLWYSWPYLRAEYARRFPSHSAEATLDPNAVAIGALTERIANVKEILESQALRIKALEEKERVRSGEEFAFITSLLMLERKITSGAPFVRELAVAMKAAPAPERAKLLELESFATGGVATAYTLQHELDSRASDIIYKASVGEASGNMFDKAWLHARGLVRIRKLHDAKPGTPQATVNATLAALTGGDVVAAFKAFELVSASAPDLWSRLSAAAKAHGIIEDAIARNQK